MKKEYTAPKFEIFNLECDNIMTLSSNNETIKTLNQIEVGSLNY